MKRLSTAPFLKALFCLATINAASAQSLPSSMAYPDSAIVRVPADASQKLLIVGNSLVPENTFGLDFSQIPANPGTVIRQAASPTTNQSGSSVDGTRMAGTATVDDTGFQAPLTRKARSVALVGVLGIILLMTRKRPNERMHGDISELRNFPKKRLAHREAHA